MISNLNRPNTISVLGKEAEVVEDYTHQGVHLDNRKYNTEAAYKNGQSRRNFLKKLTSVNICRKMLPILHKSVVESAVSFATVGQQHQSQ